MAKYYITSGGLRSIVCDDTPEDAVSDPPTAKTGMAPMCVDEDGTKLWIYINGAWKSAALT